MRQPGTAPSTEWAERIAPDEEAHLKRVAEVIGALQRNRSAKYGPGRALHLHASGLGS